jgi:nucleoside phosphorylase
VPSSAEAKKSAAVAAAGTSGKPSEFPALAASAGISVRQLQAGLIAAKRAGGGTPRGVAAFAAATGVPTATAQRVVAAVFGNSADRSMTGPVATTALARQLHVSTSAAQRALRQIDALSGRDGVDTNSAAFAAVAHSLGVGPARLLAALDGVKRSLAAR